MTAPVVPDPAEPSGGFAYVCLPGGSLAQDAVTLALQDAYAGRWLRPSPGDGAQVGIGNPAWGPEPHAFGPYPVQRKDGFDWVRIGPEIVNKLEEYAPVRLRVGTVEIALSWPDDVLPRAGAALTGGILAGGGAARAAAGPRLVGKVAPTPPAPDPVPEPDPVPVPVPQAAVPPPTVDPDDDLAPDEDEDPAPRRRSLWLLPGLLALLALAMVAAWWFLAPQDPASPGQVAEAPPPAAPDRAPSGGGPCAHSVLAAVRGGFSATLEALRACGPQAGADTALRLVEDAAAANDGAALMLFGMLYDAAATEPAVETAIGLTFEDAPPQAADYYARAVAAGHEPARPHLAAICQRLATATDTLSRGAYDDHCL